VEVFTETIEDSPENSLETDREEYNDNRQSENAKRLEDRLVKVQELLATRGTGRLKTLSAEQASLVHTVELKTSSTKGRRNLLQMRNILYY